MTVSLVAETTTGTMLTKDLNYNSSEYKYPQDLGKKAALQMLDEIFYGGCVDSAHQPWVFFMMAISENKNISSVKIGRLTEQSVSMLRLLKQFFSVEFKITECPDEFFDEEEEEESGADEDEAKFATTFVFTCLGIGMTNLARKTE